MKKEPEKPAGWSIVEARRRFSDVVRMAAEAPQALYNRGRVVGAIVGEEEFAALEERRKSDTSIGDAFQELREMCQEDGYHLVIPERRDRPHPFAGEDDLPR